jgi:hypothetical protein
LSYLLTTRAFAFLSNAVYCNVIQGLYASSDVSLVAGLVDDMYVFSSHWDHTTYSGRESEIPSH